MAQVINEMDVPSHSFVFHGTGERYFISMLIWKLTDNDFLMELLVGMFLLVVLFLFFAISQS